MAGAGIEKLSVGRISIWELNQTDTGQIGKQMQQILCACTVQRM